MRYLISTTILIATAASGYAQVPTQASRRAPGFVTQLGQIHFPGGAAAATDAIRCIEVLPSGATIVAGTTDGSLGEPNAGVSDAFVARFDATGELVWLTQVGATTAATIPTLNGNPGGPGGAADAREYVGDMAITNDGGIIIVGGTSSSLGETAAGVGVFSFDVFVARFSAAGALEWVRQLGQETGPTVPPTAGASAWGDASGSQSASSVVLDPAGGMWVAGSTLSSLSEDVAGEYDVFLAHFDSSGGLDWISQLGALTGPAVGFDSTLNDGAADLALSPTGNLVMSTTSDALVGSDIFYASNLVIFDAAGAVTTVTPAPNIGFKTYFTQLDLDSSGRIFVAGVAEKFVARLSYQGDVFVACYDPSATELLWFEQLDAVAASALGLIDVGNYDSALDLKVDVHGNPVLIGTTQSSLSEINAGVYDLFAVKWPAGGGSALWVRQLGVTTASALGLNADGYEYAGALSLGPGGVLTIGGSTNGNLAELSGGGTDALLIRTRSNGHFE